MHARTFAAALAIVVISLVSGSAQVRQTTVRIKAPDGLPLAASLFQADARGPGVLLLSQCRLDRHSWDRVANALAASGIYVLTFDYRGFGESGGHLPPPPFAPELGTDRKFGPTISADWVGNRDVEAAYDYLRSRPGVDERRIVVGGPNCGATFAADLASHHPEIRGLFMISGRISAGAAAHIASTSWLPVFGAAERDAMPVAFESIASAIATSRNRNSEMVFYPGKAHGLQMLTDIPALQRVVENWVEQILMTAGVR